MFCFRICYSFVQRRLDNILCGEKSLTWLNHQGAPYSNRPSGPRRTWFQLHVPCGFSIASVPDSVQPPPLTTPTRQGVNLASKEMGETAAMLAAAAPPAIRLWSTVESLGSGFGVLGVGSRV